MVNDMIKDDALRIGFIGAGKVGTSFGLYLRSHGFNIAGYYSRSSGSSKLAAELTRSTQYADASALSEAVDLVFITTNDGEIGKVCNSLAEKRAFKEGQIVVHMSGAHSSDILQNAREQGCRVYSLHPIQSFADVTKALSELPHTVFSIEGDPEKHTVLEDILKKTGNRYFRITPGDKVLYHAAACIFSNFLTALLGEGLRYLQHIGIGSREGFEAMLPLVTGTLSNIERLGTEAALTGPVARGDTDTIQSHLEVISSKLPDRLPLYLLMTERTLELAKRKKLTDPDKIEAIYHIIAQQKTSKPNLNTRNP